MKGEDDGNGDDDDDNINDNNDGHDMTSRVFGCGRGCWHATCEQAQCHSLLTVYSSLVE